jgi:hypothetical protein
MDLLDPRQLSDRWHGLDDPPWFLDGSDDATSIVAAAVRRTPEMPGVDGVTRGRHAEREDRRTPRRTGMTTTDDNKAIVRRFVDEIFVKGRKDTSTSCSPTTSSPTPGRPPATRRTT